MNGMYDITSPRTTAKSLNSSQSTGPSVSPRAASPELIGPVRPSSQASEKLRMIGLMTNGTASRNRKTWLVRRETRLLRNQAIG